MAPPIEMQKGWNFISVPCDVSVADFRQALGADDLVVYARSGSEYLEADTLKRGRGYLLKSHAILNASYTCPGQDIDPFEFSLPGGWSLIGNPYHKPISFADALGGIADESGMILIFDFQGNRFVSLSLEDEMKVWGGYWIFLQRQHACSSDADCEDGLSATINTCNNPGTRDAACANTPCAIACVDDSGCDDGQKTTLDTCENPGVCAARCAHTACGVTCREDYHCDDGDQHTRDTCSNPGTCAAACAHEPCTPACSVDTDCDDSDSLTIDSCANTWSCDATCLHTPCPVACASHEDCNDRNPYTRDTCSNPGTCAAACAHEPCTPACTSPADCDDGNPHTRDLCPDTRSCDASCTHEPCTPACTAPANCDDGNPATYDTCSAANTCNAACVSMPDICPGWMVTTTADTGPGSLRSCITMGNEAEGRDTITFSQALAGQTIALRSALPALSDGGTIIRNTTGREITVSGKNKGFNCFEIRSAHNEIRGLTIVLCNGADTTNSGILIASEAAFENVIAGNHIGTNFADQAGLGNSFGVNITDGAHNNTVGGSAPEDRNIISGHNDSFAGGVWIHSAQTRGNVVIGNYIGTNTAGASPIRNHAGICIDHGADHNRIGGPTPGEGNIISGSTNSAINILNGSNYNVVYGNYLGTDYTGKKAIHNVNNIAIAWGANYNTVGGTEPGQGNIIANSTAFSVVIDGSRGYTYSNRISGNSIYNNKGPGILHYRGDASYLVGGQLPDVGGNLDIPAPIITGVVRNGNTYDISGTADCQAYPCKVELFRVDDREDLVAEDPSGAGQGYEYLGFTWAPTGKEFSFTGIPIDPGGLKITATITDKYGNTSQFAQNMMYRYR